MGLVEISLSIDTNDKGFNGENYDLIMNSGIYNDLLCVMIWNNIFLVLYFSYIRTSLVLAITQCILFFCINEIDTRYVPSYMFAFVRSLTSRKFLIPDSQ